MQICPGTRARLSSVLAEAAKRQFNSMSPSLENKCMLYIFEPFSVFAPHFFNFFYCLSVSMCVHLICDIVYTRSSVPLLWLWVRKQRWAALGQVIQNRWWARLCLEIEQIHSSTVATADLGVRQYDANPEIAGPRMWKCCSTPVSSHFKPWSKAF